MTDAHKVLNTGVLTLKQQFRKNAVLKKSAAFRVWKCRMRELNQPLDPEIYIAFGYDNVKKG